MSENCYRILVFTDLFFFFPEKLPFDLNERDTPFMSAAVKGMFIFCADSALWILKHETSQVGICTVQLRCPFAKKKLCCHVVINYVSFLLLDEFFTFISKHKLYLYI